MRRAAGTKGPRLRETARTRIGSTEAFRAHAAYCPCQVGSESRGGARPAGACGAPQAAQAPAAASPAPRGCPAGDEAGGSRLPAAAPSSRLPGTSGNSSGHRPKHRCAPAPAQPGTHRALAARSPAGRLRRSAPRRSAPPRPPGRAALQRPARPGPALAHRPPEPLPLGTDGGGGDDEVGDGHHQPEDDGQQGPDGQQRVGDEGDQHELPHALLGGAGGLHAVGAEREGAAEEGEGEAEEQGELDDLLQLGDLQVLDIGDDEEGEEDDAVHRVRALGDGQAGAGEQLHQGQAGGEHDEDGQRLEGGRLLQLQVVALEESLQLLAVELVLAGDGIQQQQGRGVPQPGSRSRRRGSRRGAAAVAALLPLGLDFLKRYFLHVSAIHKPRGRDAPPGVPRCRSSASPLIKERGGLRAGAAAARPRRRRRSSADAATGRSPTAAGRNPRRRQTPPSAAAEEPGMAGTAGGEPHSC